MVGTNHQSSEQEQIVLAKTPDLYCVSPGSGQAPVQGYLTHVKHPPPKTLQ